MLEVALEEAAVRLGGCQMEEPASWPRPQAAAPDTATWGLSFSH